MKEVRINKFYFAQLHRVDVTRSGKSFEATTKESEHEQGCQHSQFEAQLDDEPPFRHAANNQSKINIVKQQVHFWVIIGTSCGPHYQLRTVERRADQRRSPPDASQRTN